MDPCKSELEGSDSLLRKVRGDFIRPGTTLAEWCRSNNLDPANAHRILRGQRNGPLARKKRMEIARASGSHRS